MADFFGGLFDIADDDAPAAVVRPAAAIPVAPQLLDRQGQPVRIEKARMQGFVVGLNREKDLELADFSSFPNVPILRRNISLSHNTVSSLQTRAAELSADEVMLELAHKRRMAELESQLRLERVKFDEARQRISREQTAIVVALEKIAEREAAARKLSSPLSPSSQAAVCQSRSAGESTGGDDSGCCICLSADRDTLVAPCGHVAMCFGCADGIRASKNSECPFCRVKISGVFKLFIV